LPLVPLTNAVHRPAPRCARARGSTRRLTRPPITVPSPRPRRRDTAEVISPARTARATRAGRREARLAEGIGVGATIGVPTYSPKGGPPLATLSVVPGPARPRDPYRGILAGPVDGPARVRAVYPEMEAAPGTAVEHRHTRVRGRVVRIEGDALVLRTELGTERVFSLTAGAFTVDGRAVTLVRPRPRGTDRPVRTASGSLVAPDRRARVARTSRIWVEGAHDAELVGR